MKLKLDHYNALRQGLLRIKALSPNAHPDVYVKQGIGKDPLKRFRWDMCYRAAKDITIDGASFFQTVYEYANDDHIDTALRRIVAELYPEEKSDGSPAPTPQKFWLIYQYGIANLYRVKDFVPERASREAQRVYQGDFQTAEAMARGAGLAGAIIRSGCCMSAGDASLMNWHLNPAENPFRDCAKPVTMN